MRTDLAFLARVPRYFVLVALLAWTAVLAGLVVRLAATTIRCLRFGPLPAGGITSSAARARRDTSR